MSRTLPEKLKAKLARKKQLRVSFNASVELVELMNKYREYFKQVHNEEMTDDVLLSDIVESAFRSEKQFQKWLRSSTNINSQIKSENGANSSPKLFEK